MNQHQDMKKDVDYYYQIAPSIVNKIKNSNSYESEFKDIYYKWIKPSVKYIENKQYEKAYEHYKNCIFTLVKKYKIS